MNDVDKIYRVVIQTPATEMLVQHTCFLAQVSDVAANRLTDEFFVKAKSLEKIPKRCQWLSGYSIPEKKYRRLILESNYMLVFQIIGSTVFVDAMVDCTSEYDWLLQE